MTILKSMYSSVKSRVRFNNKLSLVFRCPSRRVTVSFFMFNVSKDIEEHLELNGFKGISMYMTKLFILLYADDIVVFSDSCKTALIAYLFTAEMETQN